MSAINRFVRSFRSLAGLAALVALGIVVTPTAAMAGFPGATPTAPEARTEPCEIGNFVWYDLNRNGIQDSGEPGIPGITVKLYSGTTLLATTTTRTVANQLFPVGWYQFDQGITGVQCLGDYTVEVVTPAGYIPTLSNQGSDDSIDSDGTADTQGNSVASVTFPAEGLLNDTFDFGFVTPCGTIGDYVWNDKNGDGVQDAGEPGINDVTVKLYNSAGTIVLATTTTGNHPAGGDAKGYYQFSNVCAGTYKVDVDQSSPALSGLLPSPTNQGTPATDSNPHPAPVTLPTDNASDQTIDFGYYACGGEIGNFVWHDLNRNGIQDLGEPGIDGVTVQLLDAAGTTVLRSEITAGGGFYKFTGVCGGSYMVEVDENTVPADYERSPEGKGTPSTDSGPHPVPVTLDGDFDSDLDNDFGYLSPCTGMIGNYVWYDANQNGIQDPTEAGIDNVKVMLMDGTGLVLLKTETTGLNPSDSSLHGYYAFTGVCAGTYKVKVDPATVPSQYAGPTTPGAGTPSNDSNAIPATVILATDTSTDDTIDFGYISPCSGRIGDFVWFDEDHDGIQDAGESGLVGVVVNLLKTSDNSLLQSVPTGLGGAYMFSGLCPGDYKIEVVPPAGWSASPTGAGTPATDSNPNPSFVTLLWDSSADLTIDFGFYAGSLGDRVWYDTNSDGVQAVGEPGLVGWTVTIYRPGGSTSSMQTGADGFYTFPDLPAGSYTVCVLPAAGYTQTYDLTPPLDNCATRLLGAGENATNVDFGYVQPPATTSIGDFVWNDLDKDGQQDAGEPGLAGSTVTLWQCGPDGLVGTPDDVNTGLWQTTPASGAYLFSNLVAGCYFVTFTTPVGYTPTTANSGVDATDSDAVAGVTGPYTLAPGMPNLTVDAGFFVAVPGLKIEKTVSKSSIAPYEMVTYTYVVTNTGGTTLTNIVVTDDNGTPSTTSDDFTVGTVPLLAPGASASFTANVIPVVTTTSVVNGNPVTAGAVIVVVQLADGNYKVTYLQDFGINDNTYGTGAIGWPASKIHKFSDLTGSDKLEFRFFDKNGNVVIDFYVDTITLAAGTLAGTGSPWVRSYPAGYGTLGPFGGDGSWIAGTKAHLLSYTTSITDNLNNPANLSKTAALIINSPTTLVGNNVVVDPVKAPGGWDHINSYTVVIDKAAFGAAGFGGVAVPDQHNSPNKLLGPNGMSVVAKNSTVVNTAKAVTASGGGLTVTDTASVNIVVPPVSCSLAMTATKFNKKDFTVTIQNTGPAAVVLSAFNLTWPTANGKLLQINLGSNVVYTTDLNAPSASLTQAQLALESTDAKRTLAAGAIGLLKMTFVNNANTTLLNYKGSFTFGGCTIKLN